MGAGAFIKVVLKNFDVLAGPVVSLVYPLYASIQAIESKSPLDDQQWLTYWVLYSLITLFELTFIKLIEWLPFWSYTKLLLTCWLVIPYFSGAAYVYEHFVRPVFVNPQNRTVNIWYVPKMKDLFHMKNDKDVFNKRDDILTAAEKYIQENGTNAFRDIISKADNRRKMPNEPVCAEEYAIYLLKPDLCFKDFILKVTEHYALTNRERELKTGQTGEKILFAETIPQEGQRMGPLEKLEINCPEEPLPQTLHGQGTEMSNRSLGLPRQPAHRKRDGFYVIAGEEGDECKRLGMKITYKTLVLYQKNI
ncbi:hypothetical protein V2J09_019469 [Rumex salicifolius]